MEYKPIVFGIAGTKGSGKDTVASIIDYCMREGLSKADYYKWKNYDDVDLSYLYKTRIVHFADALKNICSQIFAIPRIYFDDREYKDNWAYCFTERSFKKIDTIDTSRYYVIQIEDLVANSLSLPEVRLSCNRQGKISCITTRTIMQYIGTELFRNKVSKNTWIDICINKAKDCSDNGWCIIPDVRFENEAQAIKEIDDRKTIVIKLERHTKFKDGHESENIDFDGDVTIDNNGSKMVLFYKILTLLQKELK